MVDYEVFMLKYVNQKLFQSTNFVITNKQQLRNEDRLQYKVFNRFHDMT